MSGLGVKTRPRSIFDAELEMKDAGLIAASAAATVDGSAQILDLGTGHTKGVVQIDVTAIEIASNDEVYNVIAQLSSSATFASTIVAAAKLELGANEVLNGDQDSAVGRYKLMFDNEYNGTYYRYARIYTLVEGTIATGINYTAYMGVIE